jgi:DNA helicase-2/ATP-dependent DNA helicase PcrA
VTELQHTRNADDAAPRVSADDISDALGAHRPTAEQRAVIESGLEPALVVAGAGSGKTETMAQRVLWLLANRLVDPGEILGLTFTRKAAGELRERITERMERLAVAGIIDRPDAFDRPQVSTYNAFANTLYHDHALLLGRESDGVVLGEAAAWQLARRVVVTSTDPRLLELDRSVDQVTRAVLEVAHAMQENTADPSAVTAMAEEFGALAELPLGGGTYKDVVEMVGTVGTLPLLVDLAREFDAAKQRRGFVEYSDQVALALQIVQSAPAVAESIRRRHHVVLLDEYQDTSVVQTRLLAELFAARPVMAVGDPHQSIYGWRGASAANLDEFPLAFGAAAGQRFALSTSWRNGTRILAAANRLVEPLGTDTSGTDTSGRGTSGRHAAVTGLRPSPTATGHDVQCVFAEDVQEEADAVASWLAQRLAEPVRNAAGRPLRDEQGRLARPSAAMLFRARSRQEIFLAALRERGVPFHVLGVGGLLGEPDVADLVCALRVVDDPTAGAELVRLLAGARWRIGVRDLRGLRQAARWLGEHDYRQRRLDADVRQALRASVIDSEQASLVDALDAVATAPDGHAMLAGISPEGLGRLRDAGGLFSRLRARAGGDVFDVVALAVQELGLDVETVANETDAAGNAALDAFSDALSDYLTVAETAGLSGFLGWLGEAERRDGLSPRPEPPEPGTVQVLTIHGSKGLEWDHVVVPRLVAGELPSTPREGTGAWLGFGRLPWEFRGDADELPSLGWRGTATRKELKTAITTFKQQVGEHYEREERRLTYVAVTRARHSLLLSGSFWSTQTTPRAPSPYLRELEEAGIVPALPSAPVSETNPLETEAEPILWPRDPLGGRRPVVERAARLVREVAESGEPDAGRWRDEVRMLLAERDALRRTGPVAAPPVRVPASRFKDFVTRPEEVTLELRRPMPERPYRATRLGTLFHSWVERRAGVVGGSETIDALADELDLDLDLDEAAAPEPDVALEHERLAALQRTFERSPWAGRQPLEVEREIHLPFDGHLVICKIDAVYRAEDGRYEIVDWKTGAPPKDDDDLFAKQLQLALYRLAYARWRGIDPELIDAAFYYVAHDRVVRPLQLVDEQELVTLWRRSVGEVPSDPQ